MIFLYGGIDYTVEPYAGWDLSSYRKMADASPEIARDIGKPFAHRVLGPWVAGLLPLADPAAFRVLAAAASIALVFSFHFFLRYAGLAPHLALATAVLLTFNKYWFGFTSWDYFQVNDVLSLFFMVVMWWSMLEGRWAVFGSALALGALTKETNMLMVPVAFAYLLQTKAPPKTWRTAAIAVLPGAAAFIGLRAALPEEKGLGLFDAFLAHWGKIRSPERLFRLLVASYLPVSLLPLVAVGTTAKFFKARWYALLLAALVFTSALFGANDERLTAPAFIVVYLLAGMIMQDLGFGRRALGVVVAAGFASSLHHIFGRYPLSDRGYTQVLSLGALAAVTCVALYYRLARRSPNGPLRGGTIAKEGKG
jgi:hypothetical protein